jgi:hypothetical protein
VLLASERPLPAYAEWRRQAAPLKWQKAEGSGVWHWQGDQVTPWGGRRRATEVERPAPAAFLDLCGFLKERAGTEVKEAIVFPVRAK